MVIMPIHPSYSSLIQGLNNQYCKSKESGVPAPFKCKKSQSVFYALLRKKGWDETKPMPKSDKSENEYIEELIAESKDLIEAKDNINIEMTETELAKLSTKKRKSLPEGSFCDPEGRRYPAHDASHVRNGLARIHQNPNDPKFKTILSCLKRKAKKFGIKVNENSDEPDKYQYPDTDFAFIKDGNRMFQHSKDGKLDLFLVYDSVMTIDYTSELSNEEWYKASMALLEKAKEVLKANQK